MSKKELQVKESSVPAEAYQMDDDLLDLLPRAESSDIDIARLVLVQPTSKIPGSPGEIISSDAKEVVASLGKPLSFVPIFFFKDISIGIKNGKWLRNEPKTAENAHLALFDHRIGVEDGKEVERKERLNLFLIPESELGEPLPRVYRIILKSSSFREAKKLLTEWELQLRMRQAPFSKLWTMTPDLVVDEKGKYVVLRMAKVMDGKAQKTVSKEDMEGVAFWVKTLAQKKDVVMHEQAVDEDEVASTAQSSDIPF